LKDNYYEKFDFQEARNYFFNPDFDNLFIGIGPCAIENQDMALQSANFALQNNINFLRTFLFKQRTSPYTFQGLGNDGSYIVEHLKSNYPSIKLICEVSSIEQYEFIRKKIDVVQIGARMMFNTELLKRLGNDNFPIILKRNFGANIFEWLNMAEYYLKYGGKLILLCERGIKTFETSIRFSFDITSVSVVKEISKIPIIADPSHPAGRSAYVDSIALASICAGFDGLLIETHPSPLDALSDADQQVDLSQAEILLKKIKNIKKALT